MAEKALRTADAALARARARMLGHGMRRSPQKRAEKRTRVGSGSPAGRMVRSEDLLDMHRLVVESAARVEEEQAKNRVLEDRVREMDALLVDAVGEIDQLTSALSLLQSELDQLRQTRQT